MSYNYFIKIMLYMLVDEIWGRIYYAYSFSLSTKRAHLNPNYDEMPIVNIKYDFSPIMIKVAHL